MGTYTGLRQISVTLGFIIGPILGGSLVEALGNDYRWMWLAMTIFLVLAAAALVPVTRGEARAAR
jgi:MFS family permease